jgi:hypothetical protein
MADQKKKSIGLFVLMAAIVAVAVLNVADLTRDAPRLDELVAHDAILQAPVETSSTGRRSWRGRYAVFVVDGQRATVEELCDVWNCRLPDAVKALHPGAHLTLWTSGSRIWQLNHDGELLLDYRNAVEGHRKASTRKEAIGSFLIVALRVSLILAHRSRQRRKAAAANMPVPAARAPGSRSIKLSFTVDRRVNVGRHAHTQMLSGPALERFQEAAQRRDRAAMITALVEAGLSEASAANATDALLGETPELPG